MTDPPPSAANPFQPAPIRPPEPKELAGEVFFLDPDNAKTVNEKGPGRYSIPRGRWITVGVLLLLSIEPWVEVAFGRRPPSSLTLLILSFFILPTLAIVIPWMAVRARRAYLLAEKGQLLRGVMECTSAKYKVFGVDDFPDYELSLTYAFHTPAGDLIRGNLVQSVPRDSRLPVDYAGAHEYAKQYGYRYDGFDDGKYEYVRWPKPGTRVPIAVMHVNPKLYRVL